MSRTVYTIGYQGADIARVVEALACAGIRTVADVRAVAVSRKPGFSRDRLREALSQSGIAYSHFVDLGTPKDGRDAARSGDYDRFRAVFSAHMRTGPAQTALAGLARLAGEAPTCLLCFERDPSACHRSLLARELRDSGMEVVDLYPDLSARHVGHPDPLPRPRPRQGASPPE